jgi:hypothetical protein
MANRRDLGTVLAIAGFTLLTAVSGLYLGFVAPRAPQGKPVPIQPDQGAILYQMHSMYSKPDRVRLEWRDVKAAVAYQITVMTPEDEPLFVSPRLPRNSWVIPHERAYPLSKQTVYHWKVTTFLPDRTETSEAAAFATQ